MNERIKELAEQAGFGEQWFEEHPTGCSLPKPLMLREFAELIVRECGYRADVFAALGCPVDMDPTETKPSDYIKNHFGVE